MGEYQSIVNGEDMYLGLLRELSDILQDLVDSSFAVIIAVLVGRTNKSFSAVQSLVEFLRVCFLHPDIQYA